MSDLRSEVVALLRMEMTEEVRAGFPRLKRIPSTDIIWFLDYFAAQTAPEQEMLVDALARFAALAFFPSRSGPQEVQELQRQSAAFARLRAPRNQMGYKGGTRYTELKMLCMDKGMREIGYYHADWVKNSSPLAFQPRADLLPDLSYLKSAKAPLLRKLVNAALAELFSPKKEKQAGGASKYVGDYGNTKLTVSVDFGSIMGQLCYAVSLGNPEFVLPGSGLYYERLWDCHGGWDYLTEENAPRSIDFFAEQVVFLAKLAERVNELARTTPEGA